VKPLLGLAVLLSAAAAAGQNPPSGPWQQPPSSAASRSPNGVHPAVVRIFVPDRDSTSLGSGALVAVSQYHGLVVTNWHVVRDAAGPITVAFPDGFRSPATLLRTDKDWDLAALAIWRPNVPPIPLAEAPPQLGEPLAIAGYGDGPYRAIAGRCTQYVSPGGNLPYEMVELSAPARNGDSGGPIFNSRGELAGVLFGSARGETTGSYCGRVRWFLTLVMSDFQRLQPDATMIAATTGSDRGGAVSTPAGGTTQTRSPAGPMPLASIPAAQGRGGQVAMPYTSTSPVAWPTSTRPVPGQSVAGQRGVPGPLPLVPESGIPAALQAPAAEGVPQTPSEAGFWEQVKNVLAAVGAVAILFHALRLLAAGEGSGVRVQGSGDEKPTAKR
jgi:hypothetical protein